MSDKCSSEGKSLIDDDDSFEIASECSLDDNIVVDNENEEVSCSAASSSSSSSSSIKSSLASSESGFVMRGRGTNKKAPTTVPITYNNNKPEPKRNTIDLDADDSSKCESESPVIIVKTPIHFSYNNTVIAVALDEISSFDSCTIPIAVLTDYKGSKIDNDFGSVLFPVISMTYDSLCRLFFSCGDKFNSFVLKKIWGSLTAFSLPSVFLQSYENKYNIDRSKVCPIIKIKLYKYCHKFDIITKVCNITALKLTEFNNALGSIKCTEDGKILVTITVSLYSEDIAIGIKFTIRLVVNEIPDCLRQEDENEIGFDF